MKQLYVNGRVFTGELPLAEAFAVEDGKFCAAGTSAEVRALGGAEDEIIDLQGRFVCPGFNDSHMHLLNYGYAMECCDLMSHTRSLADLLATLRRFIDDHPQLTPDQWVRGRGWNQDYFSDSRELPTRADLDTVSTEHPICIVRCCGHCLVVNSRALELLGIDGTWPQPAGGHYDLDEQGRPTGVFRDSAMQMVYSRMPQPTRNDIQRMILRACRALNSYGVTSCQSDDLCVFADLPYPEVFAAYAELEARGLLTVRVYEQCHFKTLQELRCFVEAQYRTGIGTDFFRVGPLKLLGDGSLGARTAFLRGTYADAPQEKGLALFTQQQFDDMITYAHSHGLQVAAHAIGDGILDRILSAYEKAFAACPREDHRSGIVHVQITHPEQLETMKRLGLHAYVQSIFLDYDIHIVEDRVGPELAATSYAFHSMKEMGIHVSNGTDCPVELPKAMAGIQCAVTRQNLAGDRPPYRPEEAMSVEEALRSYTVESAYASFEENVKGQIRPGYLADFVVLSADPFAVPAQELGVIHPLETYVGGKKVWEHR